MTDERVTEGEAKQLKAYLEMKAQSLEESAKTFTSNYDEALSIAKANGFREALQVIESSSYKWYGRKEKRPIQKEGELLPNEAEGHVKPYWAHSDGRPIFWTIVDGHAIPLGEEETNGS